MIEINNKTVLITGGANGIGAAIVKECLQRGAKHVSFLDVDRNRGTKFEHELREKYGENKVKYIECDVTNDDQLFGAYKAVHEDNGGIDCVVNNAGLVQESDGKYKKLIDVNYTALVTSTLKGLQLMRKDHGGKGGTIINISSVSALKQLCPSIFIYSGSKSAVLQFSNCIGMQPYFDRTEVRVITVCFGGTETEMIDNMKNFDQVVLLELETKKNQFTIQSVKSAARGLIEVYELGESGDTWLVANNKPAINWTEKVKKAYAILSEDLAL